MVRIAFVLTVALFGCEKKAGTAAKPPAATIKTGTVSPEGVRTIQVNASIDGYAPDRIPGKPGEKLVLVFTRTSDSECVEQLKTPDGKLVMLPLNKPVEVPVTVPTEGEVKFACGMDMLSGVIVAEKG